MLLIASPEQMMQSGQLLFVHRIIFLDRDFPWLNFAIRTGCFGMAIGHSAFSSLLFLTNVNNLPRERE